MPNKYAEKKGWNLPKQKYKVENWSEYNEALRNRGRIEIWLSEDAVKKWYAPHQINNGTGAPKLYSDFAITICRSSPGV